MHQTLHTFDTARIFSHQLHFQKPARTSRSIMNSRKVYYIKVWNAKNEEKCGWGEFAPLDGLSIEGSEFHDDIKMLLHGHVSVSQLKPLLNYPSVRFGIEAADLDLCNGGHRIWFPGPFNEGEESVPINGLIWMGDKSYMLQQIRQKLTDGYPCLKLKIGGIDFTDEVKLLTFIRKEFSPQELELRLDANGSFTPDAAEERLKILSNFDIHSIEQPIRAGQWETMASLCENSPIPIALDEELIGIRTKKEKQNLLETIRPQHLIFKPSLIGGLKETMDYIELCNHSGTGWWITSALESNVGLNILAQFCAHQRVKVVQGLGTGKLFKNNIPSPLQEENGMIFANPQKKWGKLKNIK